MIYHQINGTTFTPGDTVEGSCTWIPSDDEVGKLAKLAVGWRTEGRGDVDQQALYEAEIIPQQTVRFSCKIPPKAHPSYDGELIRIIWEVRVEFKSRGLIGRLGMGQSRDARVFQVVAP